MKIQSNIKTVTGTVIDLIDFTRWEVTDISTAVELPLWMPLNPIVGDDFGINCHLTNTRRNKTLGAKRVYP